MPHPGGERPPVLTDASAIVAGVALPLGMFAANKSAAFMVVLAALLALGGVVQAGRLREIATRLAMPWPPLARAGFAFAALAALSCLWADFPKSSLNALGEAAVPLLAVLIIGLAWSIVRPRRLGFLLLAGISVAAVAVMVDLKTGMAFRKTMGLRPLPFVLNRSVVVQLLLLAPMLALLPRRWQWLGVIPLALVGAAVLVSESGAAKLGLAAGLAAAGLALLAPRLTIWALAAGTALLLLTAPWVGTMAARLIPERLVAAGADAHAGDRIAIWTSFGAAVKQRPILGSGFNASARMAETKLVAEVDAPLRRMLGAGHPHNALLQIWADLGAVGAALGLAVIALLARAMLGLPRAVQPLAAALGAITFSIAAVSHGAWQAWWIAAVGAVVVLMMEAARERAT